MAVAQHALTEVKRLKGQRSRSRSYQMHCWRGNACRLLRFSSYVPVL